MRMNAGPSRAAHFYPPVERIELRLSIAPFTATSRALFLFAGRQPGALLALRHARPRRAPACPITSLRPRSGVFSGTRILFNFGESDREPTLPEQDESLYTFLCAACCNPSMSRHCISARSGAPQDRTYEGGVEQTFLSSHIIFRASYFHNEFGKQIEYVGLDLIPALLPNLTPGPADSARNHASGELCV